MFQPVFPSSGLSGWRFLQRTYDSQFEAFSQSVALKRDSDHFREKIGGITSAEELVADRQLLGVALGAFGLQDDIDNRFFIRKVLEEGVVAEDALANRFADKRYKEMAQAFGFGPGEFLKVGESAFVETIIARFEASSFEVAAGVQQPAMRVALYAERGLGKLAAEDLSNDAKWFSAMADPPLRELFEAALNLPKAVGQIDIDQQLELFKERAQAVFGTDDLSDFAEAELQEQVVDRFLVGDQIRNMNAAASSTSIALTLLRS